MGTLLAILGGVCLFLLWSFAMVKILIYSHLLGFVLLKVVHSYFEV